LIEELWLCGLRLLKHSMKLTRPHQSLDLKIGHESFRNRVTDNGVYKLIAWETKLTASLRCSGTSSHAKFRFNRDCIRHVIDWLLVRVFVDTLVVIKIIKGANVQLIAQDTTNATKPSTEL